LPFKTEEILSEVTFKTSRSGGKGGQNVNKVETKIELIFNVLNSKYLTDEEKELIQEKLNNRIDKNGNLRIVSQTERSQHMNKLKSIGKFLELIAKSLRKRKKRLKTKPTTISKENRIKKKKITSLKKSNRSKPVPDE
jgi:ribosome-associated protein